MGPGPLCMERISFLCSGNPGLPLHPRFKIGRSPSHTQLGVLEPGFRQVRVLRNPHSSRHKPEQCGVQGAGCDSDEHVAHLGYPKLLELRVALRKHRRSHRVIGGWLSHDRQAQRGGRPIELGRRARLAFYRAIATAQDPDVCSRLRSDASLRTSWRPPSLLEIISGPSDSLRAGSC